MTTQDAESVAVMTTYKRADGELIMGQYSFMTEPDYFESDDDGGDYFEVVEETWTLTGTRTLKFGSLDRWCSVCDEDVTLSEPTPEPILCDSCECSSTQGAAGPEHSDGLVCGDQGDSS